VVQVGPAADGGYLQDLREGWLEVMRQRSRTLRGHSIVRAVLDGRPSSRAVVRGPRAVNYQPRAVEGAWRLRSRGCIFFCLRMVM
jgi:hypothetical protein